MPEASGKIVPRIVNEFTGASSVETVPDFPPAVGAANEISVGAKSNAPREPLTLMGPIFNGDGSDAPVSFRQRWQTRPVRVAEAIHQELRRRQVSLQDPDSPAHPGEALDTTP